MKLVSTNPSRNYEVLGNVTISTEKEIKHAVAKAHKAFPQWSEFSVKERIRCLTSYITIAKKCSEEIAQLIAKETGRTISDSRSNVTWGTNFFEAYFALAEKYLTPKVTYETATEMHQVYREPYGVIAAICPWNYPFLNITWQCGQALLAGNTIVYKNSEENPLFAQLMEKIITQSDIPDGVFTIIYGNGETGKILVEQAIDMISFTGSTEVGQQLTKIAAEKFIPIVTELGGSAPGIICEDMDISDTLIAYITELRLNNNGQACDAIKRLIIHKSKFDEVTQKLVELFTKQKVGDANDENTDIGPLVAKRQVDLLEQQVQDAIKNGAQIEAGGKRPTNLKGAYYLPTIITKVNRSMRVWKEETFGPVLPIVPFTTEEEAITLANDTQYGLSAHVFTKDKKKFGRIAKQLQAGSVAQNFAEYWNPNNPFGGYKKSGIGRLHGEYGFEDFTQPKLVAEEK